MNKKLNVLFFILILTLFVHGGVYAEEENSSDNNTNVTQERSQNSPTKEKVLTKDQSTETKDEEITSDEKQNTSEPEATAEASNTSEAVENSDSSGNFEAVENSESIEKSEAENNSEVTENPEVTDNSEDTNTSEVVKDPELANTSDTSSEDKSPENKAEATEDKADSTTPSQKDETEAEEADTLEENLSGEARPTKDDPKPDEKAGEDLKEPKVPTKKADSEDKETENQVDPTSNDDLKNLEEQIKEEKDKAKKAELQKEYNKKLFEEFEEIEKSEAEKLDKEVLKRFTDKDKTEKFYAIQEEYQALKEKVEKGTASAKEVEDFKQKLGDFKVPRKLDDDEKSAAEELSKSPTIGIEEDSSTEEGKRIYKEYLDAKDALNKAIDAENTKGKANNFNQLLENFRKAEEAFKQALADKDIDPKYTDGTPEFRLYPLDSSGKVGNELKEDTYHIPDKTPLDLLVQVNKDKSESEFTFTIKTLGDEGVNLPEASLSNLAFLNGKPVELVKNTDGSYSFTTKAVQDFGVAQIRFNMPGFKAAFHKGFSITMSDGTKDVTKKFLITKKGYEDDADVSGIGNKDIKNPQKDVDAGETQDGYVKEDTDKVYDFFTYLKKSNAYIDKVLVNSANGESLPLSSVDVTITLPEYNGKFAEMIHKSGLKYHDLGNGKYQLKLDMKTFEGKENFKVEDGKLLYNGEELTPENISNAILEGKGGKKYVDDKGNSFDIIDKNILEDKDSTYKVQDNKLYEKEADGTYKEIGTFDKDKKIKVGKKVYELRGKTLLSYTGEKDIYEGKVTNKYDKAEPGVTETYEGKQVIVTENGKESYGGTIVEGKIFQKSGDKEKYLLDQDLKEEGSYSVAKTALISSDGKKYSGDLPDLTDAEIKSGKKTIKGVTYKIVNNAVFNKEGYILEGLVYKPGLTLIDKFGNPIKGITVEKAGDNYTFSKKDEKPKTSDGDKIKVQEGKIFVDSKNAKVSGDYKSIVGKYYYDGKKFVKAEDENVIGKKLYEELTKTDLAEKLIETYTKDGNELIVDDETPRYYGSTNKNNYYKVDDKIYHKVEDGQGTYLVKADGKGDMEILSQAPVTKIIQTLGDDEVVTDETNIFDAVQNSKFGLRFPGFLAGKDIIYHLDAKVAAKYSAPTGKKDKNGNEIFEDRSIFFDGDKETEYKEFSKYFTLKRSEGSIESFFKNAPKELKDKLDFSFFNIFFRESDDRSRDELVKKLLENEKDKKYTAEYLNKKDLSKEEKAKLEKERDLLKILKAELQKVKPGAEFKVVDGKLTAVYKDESGNDVEVERSLLWEIGFNNPEGNLFPENKDNVIVIEDHSMDNRLIYDEIIVNDTKDKWNAIKDKADEVYKKAKEAYDKDKSDENKKSLEAAKFKGSDEYFFLDEIDKLRFGVNPNFIEGRFSPLGKAFTLTGEEIIQKLEANPKEKSVEIKKEDGEISIIYKIIRDSDKGQIRIKVLNAFYKKAGENDENKFYSPAQEAYDKKIKDTKNALKKIEITDADDFKEKFDKVITNFHEKDSECHKNLTSKFKELMDKVKNDENLDNDKKKEALKKIKDKMVEELEKLPLIYLDNNKGDYKFDDMRFNAIRMELKPGTTIGGSINPQKTKKFGLTSFIVPDIDIPYTDEFGEVLTNKDMYVKAAVKEILKDKTFNGTEDKNFNSDKWDKSEETYRRVMTEAYRRVNEGASEDKFKKLVKVDDSKDYGEGKYTVKKGNEFDYEDLAVNGEESIKDNAGNPINPWFVGEDKDAKPLSEKVPADLQKTDAYKELKDKEIDITAYYMSNKGYDRAKYANKANYKLDKEDQAPGVFGKEDNFGQKCCYGIIGHCIQEAGKDYLPPIDSKSGHFGAEGKTEKDFELEYTPSTKNYDEENPKVDKSSNKDNIDLSKKEESDGEASDEDKKPEDNKSIDFNINVTVDKMTKDQKKLSNALNPENKAEIDEKAYNEKGYFIYKDALIMDILPDIFELTGKSELNLNVDQDGLMANGANAGFSDKKAFENWKKGIKYFYTEDVLSYLEELKKSEPDKAKVLAKTLEAKKITGKQGAILAWLPEFEAPYGSTNQFTFNIKNLRVNEKKYKETEDRENLGQIYTNHAVFANSAEFLYGKKDVTITDGHKGKINKYLQILDKDGNPLKDEEAKKWFKGNAELKFGDKFNYKIKYYQDKGLIETPANPSVVDNEFSLDDIFRDKKHGLRPVLRGYVKVPEGFEVLYKVGDDFKTEKQLKDEKISLAKVDGIRIKGSYPDKTYQEFILPMMIPELDAKIENGKVYYIGKDGEKVELGDAKDFFNLKDLTKADKDLIAENTVEGSNTVKVYLDKERFLKVFKEFFDTEGKEIKKDRPEVKFDIYQIETDKDGNPLKDEKGNIKKVKLTDKNGNPLQLVANEKNSFTDKVDGLPIFKKFVSIDENGNVKVEITKYKYEIKEVNADSYDVEIEIMDNGDDELGFVFKAKNTEKPEEPEEPEEPEKPEDPEEPKNPPEEPKTPPEEPEKPEEPKTPSDEPKKETEEVVKTPNKESENKTTDLKKVTKEENGTNNIPKTGVREDLMGLFISGILLGVLVYFRRKLER